MDPGFIKSRLKCKTLTLDDRKEAFARLGRIIERYLESASLQKDPVSVRDESEQGSQNALYGNILENAIKEAGILNPWFTRKNILTALSGIVNILNTNKLETWLKEWDSESLSPAIPLKVGVIMAGNLPLVGFHDFLSVLITGNRFAGKLSSRDDRLLPMIAKLISVINKDLYDNIEFTDEKLTGIDAIIATGSNNTYRYFDYYFGKYPHIFRKNRNGAAVLQGNETPDQIASLGDDIFTHFGLGCRNVSKIFVPKGYNFNKLYDVLEKFSFVTEHHKYMNNFQYYRSVYLMNKIPHYDNGFLILKKDEGYHTPAGVLYYDYYSSMARLIKRLVADSSLLQCISADTIPGLKTVPFGTTHYPELWDYADNINTIDFLINLPKRTRL